VQAYDMITNCPSEIGGWSIEGTSFLVRDVDRFAAEVIPTAYKHNKFSSFVRQLNFCKFSITESLLVIDKSVPDGFRKVRSTDMSKSHIWEFKHPFFIQGDMQSLSKIKKEAHFGEL
jgi:hypothetical protein